VANLRPLYHRRESSGAYAEHKTEQELQSWTEHTSNVEKPSQKGNCQPLLSASRVCR